MRIIHFLFLYLCLNASAFATDLQPNDFAHGLQVETDGSAAIYRLALPPLVYQHVLRKDIGDIRVFNANKQTVPHTIRQRQRSETSIEKISVPFFPLLPQTESDEQFVLNDDGAIVQYQPQFNSLLEESVDIQSYVIDISTIKRRLKSLQFSLTGHGDNFIQPFRLEHSNDLNSWRRLVPQATFSRLKYGTYSLDKNTVELPATTGRYIRFTWNNEISGVQLRDVYALMAYAQIIDNDWQTATATGKLIDESKQLYQFDTGGIYPIEQIDILLPENNTLIEATILSGEDKHWRRRYSGLFYKLEVQGNRIENTSVDIRTVKDRLWQIQVNTDDGLGSLTPSLKFSWRSDELLFVARGEGPFTLAFGSTKAKAPGKPVDVLLKVLNDAQESNFTGNARVGAEIKLGGSEATERKIEVDSNKLVLWSILVFAVLLLAIMAFRLYRQMNDSSER